MTEPKFKFGDTVVSKKTGHPVAGKICEITDAAAVFRTRNFEGRCRLNFCWSRHYPDFQEKPIYTVIFDGPIKTLTLEELYNHLPSFWPIKDKNDDIVKAIYDEVPLSKYAQYPEDDLELL